MSFLRFFKSLSRKFLMITGGIVAALIVVFFIWQHYKYKVANETIATTLANKTDSLYKITYDSIHFDAISGTAYLKNIHILPDTDRVNKTSFADQPYWMLDIKVASLLVTGVKTDKALLGSQLVGDSLMIENPVVTIYILKKLKKETNINVEAKDMYHEILGNLNLIKVNQVFINNINVSSVAYQTKKKDFDLANGNIQLREVLIDSSHNSDTTRTLFSKQSDATIATFTTYNNNRPELKMKDIVFQGENDFLSFDNITVYSQDEKSADSTKLLSASKLHFEGLDADEFVKKKNILIKKISCEDITLFGQPLQNLSSSKGGKSEDQDTTGFKHVYSIRMNHLIFPKVTLISENSNKYSLGNISIKINNVEADQLVKVQKYPIDYSKEVEVSCSSISLDSKDGFYKVGFRDIVLNSLQEELRIGACDMQPLLGERQFATKAHFQKDRYDLSVSGIALQGINMKDLINKKLIAKQLSIQNLSAKIYRDLKKPLKEENKIGKYPSQLISKINFPLNIVKAVISNAFVQYKEREKKSDSTGIVKFSNSVIKIDNITNVDEQIKKNNLMKISFKSNALGSIPMRGNFNFRLGDPAGHFAVDANIAGFDGQVLNNVSIPMALIKVNSGKINSIDFDFKGDNHGAGGHMVMKYEDLKVDVLGRDKKTDEVEKKGLKSLVANILVRNDNPRNGKLHEVTPHYDRDGNKSFFNLVWKTLFTGLKETVGIP